VERAGPTVAQHAADVSGALAPHTAELSSDIYELIVREIPQLRSDSRVLTLREASVAENVATVLHILQHGIDLDRSTLRQPLRNTPAGWPNEAARWPRCCVPTASARPASNTGACGNSGGTPTTPR
jgi:hypothetical protein